VGGGAPEGKRTHPDRTPGPKRDKVYGKGQMKKIEGDHQCARPEKKKKPCGLGKKKGGAAWFYWGGTKDQVRK